MAVPAYQSHRNVQRSMQHMVLALLAGILARSASAGCQSDATQRGTQFGSYAYETGRVLERDGHDAKETWCESRRDRQPAASHDEDTRMPRHSSQQDARGGVAYTGSAHHMDREGGERSGDSAYILLFVRLLLHVVHAGFGGSAATTRLLLTLYTNAVVPTFCVHLALAFDVATTTTARR